MGVSLRIIAINADDSLRRIPATRYSRLMDGDPSERFPEYAGQTIRYAEIIANLDSRRPIIFLRIIYPMPKFDDDGRLDARYKEEESKIHQDMWDATLGGVIGHLSWEESQREEAYLRIQRDLQFRWSPDEAMERKIKEFAFANELRRMQN